MSAWGVCPRCGGNLVEVFGELLCDTCSWPDEDGEEDCERHDCPDE